VSNAVLLPYYSCPAAGGVHSVVESLLLFLECLDTPIILDAYFDQCLQACNSYTLCKQVLTITQFTGQMYSHYTVHRPNVFTFLLDMQSQYNAGMCVAQVVGLQPLSHRNTFRYLCAFLKYIIDESLNNRESLDARKIGNYIYCAPACKSYDACLLLCSCGTT
jgi:hypothetical protein